MTDSDRNRVFVHLLPYESDAFVDGGAATISSFVPVYAHTPSVPSVV